MTIGKRDPLERSILKSLEKTGHATPAEMAAMLPEAGESDVKAINAVLAKRQLIEPVPGSQNGEMRLTRAGLDLAQNTTDEVDHTGAGGGGSAFE